MIVEQVRNFFGDNLLTHGRYPEAECFVTDLVNEVRNNSKKIEELLLRIKEDVKNQKAPKEKRYLAAHSTATGPYVSNQIENFNTSQVTLYDGKSVVLSGCPRDYEIASFIYHLLIRPEAPTTWFSLNQPNEKEGYVLFWLYKSIKSLELPDGWKIENITETDEYREMPGSQEPRLIRSVLQISQNGEVKKKIPHIHYSGWIDHEAAPNDDLVFECTIDIVNQLEKGSRVGINCKGGIGRTGTLAQIVQSILIINSALKARKELEEISINIPESNYKLRTEQRDRLVGRTPQMLQVYRIVSKYVECMKR